jgi:hypothetical protein
MLEFGFNVTDYGKTVLAACFITDLATVVALGLVFAPFTLKTAGFVGVLVVAALVLPWLTPRFFKRYGGRPSEMEAKYLLLALFGLGALAGWADSEAVLPAYLIGMVLAGTVGKDHALIRRLRTLTFGLLTPFYFLRAGSFVSVSALIAAPGAFIRQGGHQDRRCLSRYEGLRLAGQGGDVYDPPHVHRAYVRHDFLPVRSVAQDHQPGAVLRLGRCGHSERCRAHGDCQRVLHAAAPALEAQES